jgi:integrase
MIKKRAALAGITSNVHPHILRHTYATQMKKIIGAEALQRQLGHEHLSTTLGTYYHQDPLEVGGQVARGIDNFLDAIDEMTKGL